MKEFLDAFSRIDPKQLAWLIAIVVPLGAGIWAVIHWIYREKISSLETSLKLSREDRDAEIRQIVRVRDEEHEKQLRKDKDRYEHDLKRLETALSERKEDVDALSAALVLLHRTVRKQDTLSDELTSVFKELIRKYDFLRSYGEAVCLELDANRDFKPDRGEIWVVADAERKPVEKYPVAVK